jgi:glutamate dehydrogenase/leucine dehydrogenase
MSTPSDLPQLHPQDFVDFLKDQGISRFYFVYDEGSGRIQTSHAVLQPIADFITSDRRDFLAHEGAFFQISRRYDTLQGAFVHRTNRGQGAGGVRYWQYDTVEAYFRDGLRLSKGMTRKNALAGLWWGGGKGVMAHNPALDKQDPEIRSSLYREYGEMMTSIRGCYVTAEDVGTNVEDMTEIFSTTRFTTCIPARLGGSGNPSIPTARGVICGMEAALDFLGKGTLENKGVAVQGMGNVGGPLIGYLFEKGVAKVVASDISEERARGLANQFSDRNLEAKAVGRADVSILESECDILSPCATGATLNSETIPNIKAQVVCGAANNQLEDSERDDLLLQKQSILYVPDFLTNRMGIVNCANEQYGYVKEDPSFEKHLSRDWEYSIYQTTSRVLRESKETGDPPAKVAMRQADELSLKSHPIFGHRGRQIIDSLVADRWHEL